MTDSENGQGHRIHLGMDAGAMGPLTSTRASVGLSLQAPFGEC